MKKDGKKFIFARMFLSLMVIFVVIYFGSVIAGFAPFYQMIAERNALVDVHRDTEVADALINQRYEDLYEVKENIIDMSSHEAISESLSAYVGSEQFGTLRFLCKGKVYDVSGAEVTDEVEEIQNFSGLNRKACSGEYLDDMVNKSCIAFYIPIVGSEQIDGLVSIVEARNFIDVTTVLNDRALAVAVITETGYNLAQMIREDLGYSIGNDYYKFIDTLAQNEETGNKVLLAIRSGEGVVNITVNGQAHTVAVKSPQLSDGKLFVVSLSSSEALMTEEMGYLGHIVFLLIIAIGSFVVSLGYAVLYHKNVRKQIKIVSYTYPNIECPNLEQFKLDVINTLGASPVTLRRYSIVAFKISGYQSMSKHFGEEEMEKIIKQAAKIFAGFCEYEETYAYMGNGVFVMCLKHVDDESFARRIGIIKAISKKNQDALDRMVQLRFNVGVCHAFAGTKGTVSEMVESAMTACNLAREKTNRPFVVYDLKTNEKLAKDEKIESMMEDSLKNGDFKVFMQPKYNIKHDRIDSAEALVRWFDHSRADYIFPSDFIGLFETNGFIVKLDHYVYLEVLKYFQNAVERGEKIVPISVNVSRVTASMEDFLHFYIDNKKKYNVGDGFLVLEFTESFAMDDNENILRIVETLHKNGIGCSLDDFGSGFSSFNVLKNVPFDEIKLDRCFMNPGYNANNDDIMLKSVVELAKSLGMRIVQEGVETEEMLNRVKTFGCDVAQGYYYAKAISLEEYRIFIDTNTSIVYKSKVK
jgi:EAL domain-containing protein (putative c-di-GMP-specific phosphodiesterase class I)/GGDEF domain-containing protein